MKKSYTLSITPCIFEKFTFICKTCSFNKSQYVEKMMKTFIDSVEQGNFDTLPGMENLSEKIKDYDKTM